MKHDVEIEKELFKILTTGGKKWRHVIFEPSEKMLLKYPLVLKIPEYVKSCTPLLDSTDFEYTFDTRVSWIIHNYDEFPKCRYCQQPIVNWNVPCWKDEYKLTCSRECERKLAQQSSIKHFQETYGVENAFLIPQVKEFLKEHSEEYELKKKLTKLEHFGNSNYNNSKQATATKIERYGDVWNAKKCALTQKKLRSEGKLDNINHTIETKRKNNTFNTSRPEEIAYLWIKTYKHPDLIRQFKSKEYPFAVDFYSPSDDVYIEYQGSWLHGSHHFNENDPQDQLLVELWKSKHTDYYDNAVDTWTRRDVEKRSIAEKNNIKIIYLWNLNDVKSYIGIDADIEKTLLVEYDKETLKNEFEHIKSCEISEASFPTACKSNKIVTFFQLNVFFKYENWLWTTSPDVRIQLLNNREKYLEKDASELSDIDILYGFKRSGKHHGYSHFNPYVFKWFVKKYNAKTCYDPCGGWGHRLLGSTDLEKYIYNDLSPNTKSNVDRIIEFLNMTHIETHCEDARNFMPQCEFDSMFTCPPYFNLEHYECGDFKTREEFDSFIDRLFEIFENNKSCKTFGLVLREDLLGKHTNFNVSYQLGTISRSHLSKFDKIFKEKLYVFFKN